MALGCCGVFGLKQEACYGVQAAPPEVFGGIISESMAARADLAVRALASGSRSAGSATPGAVAAGGEVVLQMTPEGLTPRLLKGLFGDVASRLLGDGVHEHTFTFAQGGAMPSFTAYVEAAAENCCNWLGCVVSAATISIAPDAPVLISVVLAAQRPAAAEAAESFYSGPKAWAAHDAAFILNGEQRLDLESFELTFDNNIKTLRTLNGGRWCGGIVPGAVSVRGSFVAEFGSEAEMRRFWGAPGAATPLNEFKPGSLSFSLVHGSGVAGGRDYEFSATLPEIYYSAAEASVDGSADRVLQRVSFEAVRSDAAEIATAVLINGTEGYPEGGE